MNDEKKYIVKWKSKITGKEGHGVPVDYFTAKALSEEGNKYFKNLSHWVEEVSLQK